MLSCICDGGRRILVLSKVVWGVLQPSAATECVPGKFLLACPLLGTVIIVMGPLVAETRIMSVYLTQLWSHL